MYTKPILPITPALKARWVKALRSGKYKQGRGALKKGDNTYCCLGVLCAIDKRTRDAVSGWETNRNYLRGEEGLLRLSAKDQTSLARRNDQRRWSFSAIADYIERRKTI